MELAIIQELFNQKSALFDEIKEVENNISILEKAKELCLSHSISEKNISGILYLIELFKIINNDNDNIYKALLSEIKYQQSICDHNMQYVGHDSHYSYYKCSKCGFEEKY